MSIKIVCVDNAGVENCLKVGQIYNAEKLNNNSVHSHNWTFFIRNVRNTHNEHDNLFCYDRFVILEGDFAHGYFNAVTNFVKIPEAMDNEEKLSGYRLAQKLLVSKIVMEDNIVLDDLTSDILKNYGKLLNNDSLAGALFVEFSEKWNNIPSYEVKQLTKLFDMYLGWFLENARPEVCISFGKNFINKIDSSMASDILFSTENGKKFANKYKNLISSI